ncbi:MAG: pyruvate dehydrogenase (acetyl-transferring) E1 component subunit alpha [Lentisphaerae bacterium]|nr:MAG: pyruvate dehydrogenase (acetyl-transferring) E1 component subunit alpha [Lentisphaerota bacterium]
MSENKRKRYLKMLELMLLIRRFEERASMEYGLRRIHGFLHLYIGQEAVAVGSIANLDLKRDYVYTAYRDHGHALAMGMDPKVLMAELYGKVTGCSRGKGGSMHFFDAQRHMMGGNGIVGAHTPLAAGTALKIRYLNEDGVVLCYFGDGAFHQGVLYETLNMAKVWGLPCIFICENNQYGMGTHFSRVSAVSDFTKVGAAFDLPALAVDGMDIFDVDDKFAKLIRQTRKKPGPTFVEARTYRYVGHSISDPQKYRGKEEVQGAKQRDPITICRDRLMAMNALDQATFDEMEKRVRAQITEAVEFAASSPEPPLDDIFTDVLAP